MSIRPTLHQRADRAIADAHDLVALAQERLFDALDHNEAAHEHHKALVEHHGQGLVEAAKRKNVITAVLEKL